MTFKSSPFYWHLCKEQQFPFSNNRASDIQAAEHESLIETPENVECITLLPLGATRVHCELL